MNLDLDNLPQHVAIIMDGNRRWASKRMFEKTQGHRNAVQSVRAVVETSVELGIRALTLYAFSTENWKRPKEEVNVLMQLFVEYLEKELSTLVEHNICLKTSGRIHDLPTFTHASLKEALTQTAQNSGLVLNLAVNYGGRDELVQATQKIADKVRQGDFSIEAIDEPLLAKHLYTAGLPELDLVIRTSNEQRLSNFLLWQSAYAELYFTSVLWPDFGREEFLHAIADYQTRQRRMGAE